METFEAISRRRSIRSFHSDPVPKEHIEKILQAAILSPSSKNRQPWRFVVALGESKSGMIAAMKKGISAEKTGSGLLPNYAQHISGAENTLRAMEEAPVTVFVLNNEESFLLRDSNFEDRIFDICNIQSIGASIQNMLLAAEDIGLGSLWIGDIFFAYNELLEWLGEKDQLIAAISFGYPGESPAARPRKKFDELVRWM